MKVLIEIPDNDAVFALKVLKSLSFVKKARPISQESFELWEDLVDAASQVQQHQEGKIALKSAKELLNEL